MHLKGTDIIEAYPDFSFKTSVLKLLLNHLEDNGNKVAQIDADTGKSYTFADILQRSKSIAVGLAKAGIGPDDYVVICSCKSFLAFSIELAAIFIGAIPVLIDWRAAGEVHRFTNGHVIKAVFCEKVCLDALNESVKQMNPRPPLIVPTDINDPSMKLLLQSSEEFLLFEVKDNKAKVVLVLFTSGSTSDPKGVQISDLGLQRLGYFLGRVPDGTGIFITSSFGWITCTIMFISSIFCGFSLVFSEEKDSGLQMKLIEKFKVNFWLVNTHNVSLYPKDPSLPFIDLSSLKVAVLGGAVSKKKMREIFMSVVLKGKIGLIDGYGMTELGGVTSWKGENPLDLSKADSSGHLAPGVEVKITDNQGALVEAGTIGEVRAKTLSMTVGYWGRPDLNAEVFDSDGFFRTGDAGYFDSDGFLYIVGRATDIATHLGAKVSVSELGDLLKCHSDVLDAAVVAKRQQSNNCDLIAFVVERPGCQVKKEDISMFVSENTGKTVVFKVVHVMEAIPRTYFNKINLGRLHGIADKLSL